MLKTYARVVTGDMESTLTILRALTAKEVDLRFAAGEVEIAAIGDFCIVAAPPGNAAITARDLGWSYLMTCFKHEPSYR